MISLINNFINQMTKIRKNKINTGPNNYRSLKQNLVEMIKNELISQGIEVNKWLAYKAFIRCEFCHQYTINFYNLDDELVDNYYQITNTCVIYNNYYHKFVKQCGSYIGNEWVDLNPRDAISISLYYTRIYNFIKIDKGDTVKNFSDILWMSES